MTNSSPLTWSWQCFTGQHQGWYLLLIGRKLTGCTGVDCSCSCHTKADYHLI